MGQTLRDQLINLKCEYKAFYHKWRHQGTNVKQQAYGCHTNTDNFKTTLKLTYQIQINIENNKCGRHIKLN